MNRLRVALAVAAALTLVSACHKPADETAAPTEQAAKAAGEDTIASGLAKDSKFEAAVKAAGLDATLAGPGPYTVLVPTDAAFDKLPAGALDTLMKPAGRGDLTGLLSYHILPGTMLTSDIAKAVDAGGGKAQIPTMGGDTITATKDGARLVLTDSAGHKAGVVTPDTKRSNGVIQEIDAVLLPTK